ncbi:aldehyde ferredoxin oxidoreductase family protein [candidate division CSSED10-310 bacterium]|uniref:Aldehyde ferredoxin oxidoreductase family protein n=1 Tax=candidate division CSSED10-310 bacterium TaxID=2855610 RepID=A0ABV6YVW6_UNCC1
MTGKYKGYMGQYLDIDLSTGRVEKFDMSDTEKEHYIGNKGIASKLLYDNLLSGCAPLGEDNILILNTGPLTGSGAPTSARFNIAAKSPLTGCIGTSNCGGNFGIYLKRAGYDGVLLRGKAQKPSLVEINEDTVRITAAGDLWGLDTEKTQAELKQWPGRAVIGPAGENQVLFASVTSNERVAGRTGLGAVMGSKNVKAVLARGQKKIPIADPKAFKACCKAWAKMLRDHPTTGQTLPKYGTASLVNLTNASYTLATRNFVAGRFEQAASISGEYMAEKYLVKNSGCTFCPIHCGRVVKHQGQKIKGPEFETLGLIGSNLGIGDLERIIELNYKADLLGLDTITFGSVIGFATELCQRGFLDWGLEFGKAEKLPQLMEDIAHRRGRGAELAEGVKRMADRYGGHEFAIHSKGLELAAYEPRGAVGHGLGYATANRGGCHLNGGYTIYYEAVGPLSVDPLSEKAKPALVVFNQNAFDAISACGCCLLTSYAVIPKEVVNLNLFWPIPELISEVIKFSRHVLDHQLKLLPWALPIHIQLIPQTRLVSTLTGMNMNLGTFLEAGDRIFNTDRMFNMKHGIDPKADSLPYRLTHVAQRPDLPKSKVHLQKMLPDYYKVRGWDEYGIPTMEKLNSLNIQPMKV